MKAKWAEKYAAVLLALPLIFYLLIFTAYPMVESAILSLSKVGLLYQFNGFVGLKNYQMLISNPFFEQTFTNTMVFVFAVVAIDMLAGLVLALSLDRINKGKSVITTILMSPMILPAVVVGAIWEIIMAPYIGPLDYLMSMLGFGNVGWLANPKLALPSLIIITVWQTIPFIFLLMLAGVQSVPPQLKEAAKIDGLSTSEVFKEITMPMILPAFAVSFLMALINSFRVFDIIFVIDQGGFNPANALLTYFSYDFAFIPGFQGLAMAAIIIITLIATVIAMFFINRVGLRERLGLKETTNRVRRLKLGVSLPSFNIPSKISLALAYIVLVVAAIMSFFPFLWAIITSLNTTGIVTTLLPPASDIGLTNFVQAIYQGAGYLVSSLIIAPVVAGITILIAAPAAYAIARYKLGGTKLLAWNLYIYAIPSIVFLIPLYTLVSKLGLLNTWWALMLIYPIFTVPLATWILVGFYSDIPKEVDEAAMIDGKSRLGAFFSVILPIVRPALAVVAFFSILASYSEFMFALTIGQTPYLFNFPPRGTETATVFVAIGVSFGAGHPINYALLSAAGLIVSVPVIIISAVLQKYIIKGLWFGSVKG
ncbi:MAG: ABC transporter permease subunit [Nitrososphaerota archaeon]|jgi:multiple sugar transport system permease protein|nr:ABC transporter permease subunit [Nitrososphaerota archaeon]MDG6929795.1 ABC transporter permease subunit [Nitrososphaerota archaeon]